MPLNTKSDQNILLIDYFESKDKDFWGALGSRPYYSVFQKIKKLLIDNNFDYKAFLKEYHKEEERDYSHGTIIPAFTNFILKKFNGGKIDITQIRCLNDVDSLYNLRLKSDYRDVNITKEEIIQKTKKAKIVNNFIKTFGV